MSLWASLSVVLAHMWVISGNETNDALLALVANVDTHKHRFIGNLWAEVHAPEVSSKFGIDLSDNI